MKKYLLFAICAIFFSFASHAEGLTDGEYGFKYDSITPNMVGQATNDHLFVQRSVSFFSGDVQTVWFYLNDDEIYQNSKVQSLTPTAYNTAGDRYNEITYNSFQCDIYLPEGISFTRWEDEEGNDLMYMGGDRMPTSSTLTWSQRGTKVIDGKTYNVYSVVCYNTNTYGCHFSAKSSGKYKQNGALKKEHTLFALFLHNDNQDQAVSRLDQDLIIANQIFNIQESTDAGWDPNASTFFYGTGGNNQTQVFLSYDRTGMYGSSGYDRNYFFLPENTVTLHNKTITLPVRMQNEDAISGFQTELLLPNGFTIPMQDDQYQVSLSDRKAADHRLEVQPMENGMVKITSQSPSHTAYSDNDGVLFYITLQVPSNVDDTYTLYLCNTELTGTEGQPIYVNDASGNITVYPYNPGDVNNNSYYTVGDIAATASYMMGNNPSTFYFLSADMNEDNALNMDDLNLMSDIVLEDEAQWSDDFGRQTSDLLHIEDLSIVAGDKVTIDVKLDNQQAYTAFQTDIRVSEGLSIHLAGQDDAFSLSDRASEGHLIDSYLHEDNSIRVMSYSPVVANFDGNEGTLFSFDIVADAAFTGPGSITLSRTLFSTDNGTEYRLADSSCAIKRSLRGDVNGDGVVNVADINVIVNIILGGHVSSDIMRRADVNNDGVVNVSDINMVISLILA